MGWRGVFLVNLPVITPAIAARAWVVPQSGATSDQRLDWPGALLGAVLTTSSSTCQPSERPRMYPAAAT